MAFYGFTRQLAKNGGWLKRVAIGGDTTPYYAPLYIEPSDAPSATAAAGALYVDTNGVLQVHNGTNFVAGGGGNITVNVPIRAAAEAVDSYVFIADRAYKLVSVEEIHVTAGTDGSAVTIDVKKCTGTQAPSAGTTMLAATINAKGTASTTQTPALSATAANLALADGDKVALDWTGTPTAYAGGVVTLVFRPI